MKSKHTHTIMRNEKGKPVFDEDGYIVCKCGATTYFNCGWFEPKMKTNSLTNQEPMEALYKKFVGNLPSCSDEAMCECSKCQRRRDNLAEFKRDISKWLQQERNNTLKFKGKIKREWYQKGYSDALREHKQT